MVRIPGTNTRIPEYLARIPEYPKWLKPEWLPKPALLLKLGKLFGVRHSELVSLEQLLTPQVDFRKSGNYKICQNQVGQFQYVARLLKNVSPYLPFDKFNGPTILSSPIVDYKYIQEVASVVRGRNCTRK